MTLDATDLLADAPDISVSASAFSGVADWDNTAATDDPDEDSFLRYAYGVWHKVFVPAAGTCTFQDLPDAASTDTYMEVFTGPAGATSPAALTPVAHNDDDAGDSKPLVTYDSPGGEWVYIAHTAYNGAQVSGQRMSWSIPSTSTTAQVSFGDLTVTATLTDRPTAVLYDTDGTWLAALPLAAGIQYQAQVSAAGAVSLRLPLDDPTTALATSRRIFKIFWRGKERQAARIDSSSTEMAVDGRIWRQWSNLPGILNVFGGVPIYPEYGLDSTSNAQRTFGYMSRYGHGAWLDSGNFTPAVGVDWSAMSGARAGHPDKFPSPSAQWIAKRGPNNDEPAGSFQYFRHLFPTTARMLVEILATGDNFVDLWLDGEQLVNSQGQNQFTWRNAFQINMVLPPSPDGGRHTLAARVRNNADHGAGPNRMGLLFVMREVDAAGNQLDQPPIVNSNSNWDVSDIAPGFRKAEVILRLWLEAQLYGYSAIDLVGLAFTRDSDSDGQPWAEDPAEYTFDVGSSLLDALTAFAESGVDINVDPRTLKLKMWNRRGSDKTATVALALGRDGGNLISHRVDRIEPTTNTVIMQLADGRWVQRQNTSAVADWGREAVALSVGSTSDVKSAYQVADAQLLEMSLPTVAFTTQVASSMGPQLYEDFDLGDTVTAPNENNAGSYAVRLMSATVDASTDGPVQITVELVLDRSATPPVLTPGGQGTDDPGDVETPTPPPVPTPAPTPTPDPPADPAKPLASNTGVTAGTTLTTYPTTGGPFGNIVSPGVLTIVTDNLEIHGWDFPCRIDVAAKGVNIHHNRVRGHANLTTARGLINCLSAAAVDALIEYNFLRPDQPNINWQGGVLGHSYTARHNNISGTVDGFGRYNSTSVKTYVNVVEEYNYVHDLAYFSPDPTHSTDTPVSKTHNDDGQWQGGLNLACRWNNYEGTCDTTIPSVTGEATGDILRDSSHKNSSGGYNVDYPNQGTASTMQATAAVAPIGNLVFEDNWCGSDIKIHAVCPNSSIQRNKFSRGRSGTNVPQIILTGVGSTLTTAGNVYEDNGHPVQVIKDGVVQP